MHKLVNKLYKSRYRLLFGLVLIAIGLLQQTSIFDNEAGLNTTTKLNEFITLFLSLIIEATPFVFLGVTVSTLVAIFLKDEWVIKILPKNRALSHIIISLLGVFMPVCECGNVPVVRRFLLKGFRISHSITFLLAAPIINPITIWSTVAAFPNNPEIVIFRMGAALFIANFLGILLSFNKNDERFLTEEFYKEVCDHDHSHNHKNKLAQALDTFQSEFSIMITALTFGSVIAAFSQSFIPREAIQSIGSNPFLSILAMILLAFVISICANVDAFFASSLANRFTLGSLTSFLVFGPMIDIKILTMLKSTFKFKFLVLVAGFVFLFSVIIGLLVNYIY